MPANTEPAHTLGSAAELARLNETLSQFPGVVDRIVGKHVVPQSAPAYETYSFAVGIGSVSSLLGFDLTRLRALVSASSAGLHIGKAPQLAGGTGFILPTGTPVEVKTTEQVFVTFTPADGDPATSAIVSVLVETNVNA